MTTEITVDDYRNLAPLDAEDIVDLQIKFQQATDDYLQAARQRVWGRLEPIDMRSRISEGAHPDQTVAQLIERELYRRGGVSVSDEPRGDYQVAPNFPPPLWVDGAEDWLRPIQPPNLREALPQIPEAIQQASTAITQAAQDLVDEVKNPSPSIFTGAATGAAISGAVGLLAGRSVGHSVLLGAAAGAVLSRLSSGYRGFVEQLVEKVRG